MIRKNDKRKAGSSCCQKVLAVLLAVTLACSSSGMLSLAEEASRENMEGYVDPEAQAAEEAARIAEEQAAAEQRAAESAEELPEETSEAELEEARALAETEPEAAWTSYEAEADGIAVSVEVPAGALPDGVQLQLTLLDQESEDYRAAKELLSFDPEETQEEGQEPESFEEAGLDVLQILFTVNGAPVEPAEPVLLQICFSQFPGEKTPAHSEVLEIWQFLTAEDGTPDAVLVAEAGEKSEGRVDIGEMQAEFTTAALGTSYGVRFPLYS